MTQVGKLVVLTLEGDLEQQGLQVMLEIGPDGDRPSLTAKGVLPPAPDLVAGLHQWRSIYRNRQIEIPSRIQPQRVVYDGFINRLATCRQTAQELAERLNAWLSSDSFRIVDRRLREELHRDEYIRLLIRTEDWQVCHLPWQEWEFLHRYRNAEIALSGTGSEHPPSPVPSYRKQTVRILAILGDRTGIDVESDRQQLAALPNAEVTFLVEPDRQQLNHTLWEQAWDILFFAGHSQTEGDSGRLYLNPADYLSLSELKHGLTQAIANGLQLAIFNSCDGLGLAHELQQLHLPQMIVMREPIPDQVAQAFLHHWLAAFASGMPLYLSVRRARERLQGLEPQFPCATWLPMIWQNPAQMPPTWQHLSGQAMPPPDPERLTPRLTRHSLPPVMFISLAIALIISGVRYVGLLQPWELAAFDQFMRSRSPERRDQRLLIVAITGDDLKLPEQQQRTDSHSDQALTQLLQMLTQYQPRVIGLDIYRDRPVPPDQPLLAAQLHENPRLVAVCKASDPEHGVEGIAPPPEVPSERLGFSDFWEDPDGVLRRQMVFMTPAPASPCQSRYAFSTQIALHYLLEEGIEPAFTADGNLQLGTTVFQRLRSHTGGYQGIDASGNQIVLNYRSTPRIAEQVTLSQVLTDQVNPESIRDRIVLIGVDDGLFGDLWKTPDRSRMKEQQAGVVVQAHMISHLLSAVLDQRPLIWSWTLAVEVGWIGAWSLLGGLWAWWRVGRRSLLWPAGATVVLTGGLCGICFVVFLQGGWIPLVPALLAFVITGGGVTYYLMTFYKP